jgi:iron complex transport system permease protein
MSLCVQLATGSPGVSSATGSRMTASRKAWVLTGFGTMLLALVIIALGIGRYGVGLNEFFSLIFGRASRADAECWNNIFFHLRLPRIIAAVLIGASLAVAGASYQAMFANPLASPNLCGVQAGACFGAALGMTLGSSWLLVQFLTFVFGFAAVGVAVGMASLFRRGSDPMLLLILGGVIAAALFSALLAIVKYTADPYDKLPSIVYWLMGSLAAIEWSTLGRAGWVMGVALVMLCLLGPKLDVLSLGDETAQTLGVDAKYVRLTAIVLATLLSSLTVVLAGEIGWVGLIIPHVARLAIGPDNRFLLPACALLGGIFLLVVDTFARAVFTVEIPVGIITALFGVVAFVLVLNRVRRAWS